MPDFASSPGAETLHTVAIEFDRRLRGKREVEVKRKQQRNRNADGERDHEPVTRFGEDKVGILRIR